MDREAESLAAEIFADALELPTEDRNRFLSTRCGTDAALRARVESLLAAQPKGEAFLRSPALQSDLRNAASAVVGRHAGNRLGPYLLTRLIASGGMGLVYLAERRDADFEQCVAVKLLHGGMDSGDFLLRFRTERQLLARLQHPNIARLIDGGTTPDGAPYLVMEYVDGLPLDRYCDERKLPLRERLQIFCTVCDAVQYAHRNLIVHRDIKPNNLLVDANGQVKLMDFGIAKVLDPEASASAAVTATALRVMTPRYASPEQMRGESITTVSDVYSLGVVLYEILTGRSPYRTQKTWSPEFVRIVCEEEPPAPSAIVTRVSEGEGVLDELAQEVKPARSNSNRDGVGGAVTVAAETMSPLRSTTPRKLAQLLTGDLDTIVLEALHKEPERRYASAEALAQDIRRHLSGLPVLARPDTLRYRVSKFARRNRALVAGVSVAFAALAIGLALSVTLYRRAVQARERELRQHAAAEWLAYEGSIAAAESSIRTNRLLEAHRQLEVAPVHLRGWEWKHLASRLDRSLISIPAHEGAVTEVRLTPDGTRIVSASIDRTIRVWDARTGVGIARFGPLGEIPRSLAVNFRGTLVAVGLEMGRVQVLDLADGHEVFSLSDTNLAWYQPRQKLWEDDTQMALLDLPSNWVMVDFDPRADRLAVGYFLGVVELWELQPIRKIQTWKQKSGMAKTLVRFRPDGKQVVIGSEFLPPILFDVANGQLVRTFAGQGNVAACFDPSGRRLAASSQDQSIEVWDVDSGATVAKLRQHGGSIRALEFDATGEVLVSGATDMQVVATELQTGRRRWVYQGHTANVHSMARSPDGSRLVTGDWDGVIKVWGFESSDVRELVDAGSDFSDFRRHWAEHACLLPDGSRLVSCTIGTSTQVWDLPTGRLIAGIALRNQNGDDLSEKPMCVASLRGSRFVVAGLSQGSIAVQDPDSPRMVQVLLGHTGEVSAIDTHPELPQFVSGGRDSTLRFWELGLEHSTRIIRNDNGGVRSVRYDPQGRWIASGSEDGTIQIWDARAGRLQHVLRGHEGAVRGLAFAPDGDLLASASFDGTIRLWNATEGSAIGKLYETSRPMYAVAFTHDGSRLAAAGMDGIVRLFDPAASREVARLHGHDDRVFWLGFTPADAALLSSSLDGTIRIWDVAKSDVSESPSTSP